MRDATRESIAVRLPSIRPEQRIIPTVNKDRAVRVGKLPVGSTRSKICMLYNGRTSWRKL